MMPTAILMMLDSCRWIELADSHYTILASFQVSIYYNGSVAYDALALPIELARLLSATCGFGG